MHANLCETLTGLFRWCLYTAEYCPPRLHRGKGKLLKFKGKLGLFFPADEFVEKVTF